MAGIISQHPGFGLKWDAGVFKFITLWCVYGGYFNFPYYGRTHAAAVEPWSVVSGTLEQAIKMGLVLRLASQQEMTTSYTAFAYPATRRIRGFTPENNAIEI